MKKLNDFAFPTIFAMSMEGLESSPEIEIVESEAECNEDGSPEIDILETECNEDGIAASLQLLESQSKAESYGLLPANEFCLQPL